MPTLGEILNTVKEVKFKNQGKEFKVAVKKIDVEKSGCPCLIEYYGWNAISY